MVPMWQDEDGFREKYLAADRNRELLAARRAQACAGCLHALKLAVGLCLPPCGIEENLGLVAIFLYAVALRVETGENNESGTILILDRLPKMARCLGAVPLRSGSLQRAHARQKLGVIRLGAVRGCRLLRKWSGMIGRTGVRENRIDS